MNQAKSAYSSLVTQRAAMENNAEFTDEDRSEVDSLLSTLNVLAKELITPEA